MKNKVISLIIGIIIGGIIVFGYSMFFGNNQMRPNGPMGEMGQNFGTGTINNSGTLLNSTGSEDLSEEIKTVD